MEVVILGMHRSGTSLVASICHDLGVHMGERLLPPSSSNPLGHWEDMSFYELNMDILRSVGGTWANPPSYQAIMSIRPRYVTRIQMLIHNKSHRPHWGWKDPRTCLTYPLYRPYLQDPRVIVVDRDDDQIISSLIRRSGGTTPRWRRLCHEYRQRMTNVLIGERFLIVNFEGFINRFTSRDCIQEIVEYLGIGEDKVETALQRPRYRT